MNSTLLLLPVAGGAAAAAIDRNEDAGLD